MFRVPALGLALTALLAAPAAGAGQSPRPPVPRPAPQAADATFVTKAADASARLLELGRLGTARGAEASVKVFAKRLVEEQTAIAEGLAALARARRIELAPPPAAVRQEAAELARRSGPAFDSAFVGAVLKVHDAAVALFESEAADGGDDEIKEWAARHLPALRDRQAKARALHAARARADLAGAGSSRATAAGSRFREERNHHEEEHARHL